MTYLKQARHNVQKAVQLISEGVKTEAYYQRTLNRAVLRFFRDEIDALEFIGIMIRLVEGQFIRAWNSNVWMRSPRPPISTTGTLT